MVSFFFFFQAEDGIRDVAVTGVQTCALPIWRNRGTLRGSLFPRDNGPVRHLHRCNKPPGDVQQDRSEEHTSELQSRLHLVCRLLLEKKKACSGLTMPIICASTLTPPTRPFPC